MSRSFSNNSMDNLSSVFYSRSSVNNITDTGNQNTNIVCSGPMKKSPGTIRGNNNLQTAKKGQGAHKPKQIRKKTVIKVVLTSFFSVTVLEYLACLSMVAKGEIADMSNANKAGFFFAFRIVFLNHVVNPIVFFVFDRQFRKGIVTLKSALVKKCNVCKKTSHAS